MAKKKEPRGNIFLLEKFLGFENERLRAELLKLRS
jgi:hypothetical protein